MERKRGFHWRGLEHCCVLLKVQPRGPTFLIRPKEISDVHNETDEIQYQQQEDHPWLHHLAQITLA